MDKRYVMLIAALDGTPRDLARLVKPLAAGDTHWRTAPDEWSVAMVVAHLSYIEDLFVARLRRIVETEHPTEKALEPDPAEHEAQANARTLAELLEVFKSKRAETTVYLSALTQPQWLRTCNHQTHGVTRLRKQVEILIGHDNEHLAQIVDIREKAAVRATNRNDDGKS